MAQTNKKGDFTDIKVPDRILAVSDSAYVRGKLKYKADSTALRDSLEKVYNVLKFAPQTTDSLIERALDDLANKSEPYTNDPKNVEKKYSKVKKYRKDKNQTSTESDNALRNNPFTNESEARQFFTEILNDKTPIRAVLNLNDLAQEKRNKNDSINLTNLTIASEIQKTEDMYEDSIQQNQQNKEDVSTQDEGFEDLSDFANEEDLQDSLGYNTDGIVRENRDNYNDAPAKDIVIVAEQQLTVDSIWVTMAEYYSVWNTEYVNPYNIDINKFDDTVVIKLYDTTRAHCWFPPLDNIILTSEFGPRWGRWHHGSDIDVEIGDPVYAVFDGIVRISQYGGGYGKHIVLRHHNGLETVYGHLNKLYLKVGDVVTAGQQIGEAGNTGRSTGPHLHFEIRYQGYAFNPRYVFDLACAEIVHDSLWIKPSFFKHLRNDYRPSRTRYASSKTYNSSNGKYRNAVYHTVRSGDTLWAISRRYKVSVSQLCKLNGLSAKAILKLGKRLRIR